MLEYDFTKRKSSAGKMVFALTLNAKKMTERVVIGEINKVRRHLSDKTGEIYFDQTRPLGQLLIDFETDKSKQWHTNIMRLSDSYSKIFPFERERWRIAASGTDFLRDKYVSGEPTAIYAAIRTWEDYLHYYNVNHGSAELKNALNLLYRPFYIYDDVNFWDMKSSDVMSEAILDGESQVELWYPMKKRPFECVVSHTSFLPLICYYLYKIEEWNFAFQKCKVCDKYFLARNRYFGLCSDECRRLQSMYAQREFSAQKKGDEAEQNYETAYHYWYNRQRKLRGAESPDTDKISVVLEAFKGFKKEAFRRKNMVKQGELDLQEFSAWLVEKQGEVDGIMGELIT